MLPVTSALPDGNLQRSARQGVVLTERHSGGAVGLARVVLHALRRHTGWGGGGPEGKRCGVGRPWGWLAAPAIVAGRCIALPARRDGRGLRRKRIVGRQTGRHYTTLHSAIHYVPATSARHPSGIHPFLPGSSRAWRQCTERPAGWGAEMARRAARAAAATAAQSGGARRPYLGRGRRRARRPRCRRGSMAGRCGRSSSAASSRLQHPPGRNWSSMIDLAVGWLLKRLTDDHLSPL